MDYTILVNKNNMLDKSYIPGDLVATDNNENNFHGFEDPNLKPMISKSILIYFLEMQKEAKRQGFNIIVDSGYRSYEYQQTIWNKFVNQIGLDMTKIRVAPPGASDCGICLLGGYKGKRHG